MNAASYLRPNQLVSQVLSSPGTALVFLWEYIYTLTIPSEIANIALHNAESYLINYVNCQIQCGVFAIPFFLKLIGTCY